MSIAKFFSTPAGKVTKAALTGVLTFIALGSVSALWENPIFIRMTPAGDLEILLLLLLSLLLGIYVGIKRPRCSVRTAGIGSVLGFLGIACPVCNKLLLFLLGADLLLTHIEPIRIYVAMAGVVIAGVAVIREWQLRGETCEPEISQQNTTPVT